MSKNYMGIDQWGNTYHNLGEHPRKMLIERIGAQHVNKMYIERKDGSNPHIGYVVGQHWVTLYEVTPFEEER